MNSHVVKNFATGRISVQSNATTQLSTTDMPLRQGVMLYADSGNPGAVWVGNQFVTAWSGGANTNDGFPLRPLDRVNFDLDNGSGLFLISNVSGVNWVWYWAR